MIIAMAILAAGIVSDNARMFISGGEWLPDEVPNSAIYDTPTPDEKELQITTNVAAAVASCVSGLCERYVVGASDILSGWWYDKNPDLLGMETFKTNMLEMYGMANPEEYLWLCYPTNRELKSYRFISPGMISCLRDVLKDFADGYWNDQYDYGVDTWGGVHWGSSILDGDPLPTWEWDDRSPREIVTDNAWFRAWPQYTSCTNDGIWRTSDHPMHSSLENVFSFLRIGPHEQDVDDLSDIVATNSIHDSCYRILEDRIGTNANQFASDTYRLSYHRLGAIETAISSMDTTYSTGKINGNDFDFHQMEYFHARGYKNANTPSFSVDWNKMEVLLTDDVQWTTYETWVTITNDIRSYSTPFFVCGGDSPKGHQSISGSCSIYLNYDQVMEMGIEDGEVFILSAQIIGGSVRFSGYKESGEDVPSISFPLDIGQGYDVKALAGVTRSISVEYTSSLMTNSTETVSYPVPWAWKRGMVDADLRSVEYRAICTNSVPESDTFGYYPSWRYDDSIGQRAETRIGYVGGYGNTNSYLKAWRAQRMRHRSAVSNMLSDFLGCTLTDREALIPIPLGPCGKMRDEASNEKRGTIRAELQYMGFVIRKDNGIVSIKGTGPTMSSFGPTVMSQGDAIHIGRIEFSVIEKLGIDVELDGRPPCFSWGDAMPASRIKWKFSNLYEE